MTGCKECGEPLSVEGTHVCTRNRPWEPRKVDVPPAPAGALSRQVDGGHYKDLKIQPLEYIHANGIPFAEGCVIKYVSRWRAKGGVKDLEKAKHFIELLIELESRK